MTSDAVVRFEPAEAIPLLARTPAVLHALLDGLPEVWTTANEGPGTWSAFDVVGHLIHGERTDWIPRAELILAHGESRTFDVFDRFAMFEASRGKSLGELLSTFAQLRAANVARLEALRLAPEDLARRGRHPELGSVTLVPDTTGGVFEVRLGDKLLWSRKEHGRFPEMKELKQLVRDEIAPGRDLGHSDKPAHNSS